MEKEKDAGFLQLSECMVCYLELKIYMGCVRKDIITGPQRHSFFLSLSYDFPCMYSSSNTNSLINMESVKVNSLRSAR